MLPKNKVLTFSPDTRLKLLVISVGIDLLVVVPSPNSPDEFRPQVKTRPIELMADE